MNIEIRKEKLQEVRENGFVPGVIYGKGFDSTSIQVPALDLTKAIHKYGTSKTFSITLDGKKHIVYVKEYQASYMKPGTYVHFDLVKVAADDVLHANVSLHFIGKEQFNKSNLVFTNNLDEVEIEYNVGSGVSFIDVDVNDMVEDSAIYVKDLVTPKGIKILNNPDEIVCSLSQLAEIVEEEESDVQLGVIPEPDTEEE